MADQIYAVLIALEGDSLLLPNLAVAEVVGRAGVKAAQHLPPWFAGHLDWNNRRVPVVHFETLNGGRPPPPSRRERVVVLHSPGVHLPGAALAIVAQGYPHLVTLTRAALKPQDPRASDRARLMLARARIASREALIPDLEAVEAEVASATATALA